MNKTVKKVRKKTLKDFVEENDKLLSVFGIFGGLTAFFVQLGQTYLAFSSFFAFFLLLLEVWFSFPRSEEASTTMAWFEYAFLGIFLFSALYLVVAYSAILLQLSFVLFLAIYTAIATKIIQTEGIARKVSERAVRSGRWDVVLRSTVGLGIIGSVLLLALLSSRLLQALFH